MSMATPTHSHRRDRVWRIAVKAMEDRGLRASYSDAVQRQLGQLHGPAHTDDAKVRDMRAMCWVSIDNDDSRDLDQLSYAELADEGHVRLYVAIADVDALVRRGDAIDEHAQANTTSVYTAAGVFAMLPEQLSTDWSSLNEGQDRLAVVTEMLVSSEGAILDSNVFRALVCNRAQLAYNGVAAWLDAEAAAPSKVLASAEVAAQLRLQDRVAAAMKARRHDHGALTLQTAQPRPVYENDEVSDMLSESRNRSKDLIEDFMVAVNGVTVRFLDARGFPTLRRVLRAPERWARIVELAAEHGATLPAQPSAVALETFLQTAAREAPSRFQDLSLSVVKLLGRGEYVCEPAGRTGAGHFGLAVRDYAHSTAPNRRYPDLLTQRLLKAALAGQPVPYSMPELEGLARHCTECEDAASKVERLVRKAVAAQLLEHRIGESFDAIVTGASAKGTWVRIAHPEVEGRVVSGSEGLDVGQRVRVRLVETNVERGFIDFARMHR